MDRIALSFFLMLAAVCGVVSKGMQHHKLNQEFKLKMGQEAKITTAELQIKFVSVVEDSRCPKGEQCFTQGNGKIRLELRKGNNKSRSIELNTSSGPQEAVYGGYTVKLIALDPYPTMNRVVNSEDYVATLAVLETTDRNT